MALLQPVLYSPGVGSISFIGIKCIAVIALNSRLKCNLDFPVVGMKPCKTILTLCTGRMC